MCRAPQRFPGSRSPARVTGPLRGFVQGSALALSHLADTVTCQKCQRRHATPWLQMFQGPPIGLSIKSESLAAARRGHAPSFLAPTSPPVPFPIALGETVTRAVFQGGSGPRPTWRLPTRPVLPRASGRLSRTPASVRFRRCSSESVLLLGVQQVVTTRPRGSPPPLRNPGSHPPLPTEGL